MKEKLIKNSLLITLIYISSLFVLFIFLIYKYTGIALNIDNNIRIKNNNIIMKEKELNNIKNNNKLKEKQLKNTTTYLDELKEKASKYEK